MADWFDRYALQARLAPALLCLFPIFLFVAVSFPKLYETAAGLVGLALACGVLTVASHFARSCGKRTEQRLVSEWGGLPTTLALQNKDGKIDGITHERYVSFFQEKIPNWSMAEGDRAAFDSAVRWLIGQTRDSSKFSLLLKENISYGFRRNCRGLKPFGVVIAIASIAAFGFKFDWSAELAFGTDPLAIGATGVSVCILVWWTFIARDDWVLEAGDAYAHALLSAIDGLE